jgi:hypothetical protein
MGPFRTENTTVGATDANWTAAACAWIGGLTIWGRNRIIERNWFVETGIWEDWGDRSLVHFRIDCQVVISCSLWNKRRAETAGSL